MSFRSFCVLRKRRCQRSLAATLTAPTSIGGTTYQLASVEYCIELLDAGAMVDRAVLVSDVSILAGLQVIGVDNTDRTSIGCYALTPTSTSGRSFALMLRFGIPGDASKNLWHGAVRSTWLPAA